MMLAAVLLANAISLDAQSGVWFPPAGRRDDYIDRRRSYSADLKEAFADPALMTSVCTAVAAAPQPGTDVEPRLRQMRMMLNMACVAAVTTQREQPAADARAASLGKQFEEAFAFAETIPPEKRRAAEQELLERIDAMTVAGPERLAAIVRAIALRPQDARGAWMLLSAMPDSRMSGRELAVSVERLYRERAAAIGPEAPQWEAGLREVLLYVGKDDEAQRLTEATNDRSDYGRMLLAFLQEIHGTAGAIDAAFTRCADAQFCRNVIWSLATRTGRIRGQLTPAPVAAIVDRAVAWYLHDWPVRLETVRVLAALDPRRGRMAVTAMYAAPEIPSLAVLDAMQIDAGLSFAEKDHLRSIALRDCWLLLRGIEVAPLPPDGWLRFAALDEPRTAVVADGCAQPEQTEAQVLTDCTSRLLLQRMRDATYAREWPLARQSVEKLVSATLASKLAPTVTRAALAELAASMSRDGDAADAARIVRYLDRQPSPPALRLMLEDVRKRIEPSQEVTLEPWDREATDPAARLPKVCGH